MLVQSVNDQSNQAGHRHLSSRRCSPKVMAVCKLLNYILQAHGVRLHTVAPQVLYASRCFRHLLDVGMNGSCSGDVVITAGLLGVVRWVLGSRFNSQSWIPQGVI